VTEVTPAERAAETHRALVEALKQLNRADVEQPAGEGLEQQEILLLLRRGPCPGLTDGDLGQILDTLLANGLAERIDTEAYAWDRGRVLGPRYGVTFRGKEYLMRQLEHAGRID
jgi:hypothetical protein